MITENFKPYLIEVNMNPCLETSCNLLNRLIPNVIEQSIRIAIDPLFPPPFKWPKSKRSLVPDNFATSCKYKLIFDSDEE